CRPLRIGVRQAQKVIRVWIADSQVIGSVERTESQPAVHVVIERLIKTLVTNIPAEFDAVRADNLAVVVAPLECVANLRQLPLPVISDRETAADLNVRHPFFAR